MQTWEKTVPKKTLRIYNSDLILVHDPQIAVFYVITTDTCVEASFLFFFSPLGKPPLSVISKNLLTFERLISKLYFSVTKQG